jgi:hypothetical protein
VSFNANKSHLRHNVTHSTLVRTSLNDACNGMGKNDDTGSNHDRKQTPNQGRCSTAKQSFGFQNTLVSIQDKKRNFPLPRFLKNLSTHGMCASLFDSWQARKSELRNVFVKRTFKAENCELGCPRFARHTVFVPLVKPPNCGWNGFAKLGNKEKVPAKGARQPKVTNISPTFPNMFCYKRFPVDNFFL